MFNYNVNIVIMGTAVLGVGCGILGVFVFYQKRALISDAISHATLPGITVAYLLLVAFGLPERSLGAFIIGALCSAILCSILYQVLKRINGIHSDAIIAILLSSFFGLGVAFLGIIQRQPRGYAAGLSRYIYGDTASVLRSDVYIISIAAACATAIVLLLFKEIVATTFDKEYARSIGIKVNAVDGLLLLLTISLTVVGIQAVGLVLMIAFFIIPSLSAKYWTQRITHHLVISALFAVGSAISGTILSSLLANLPTGATIVMSAGVIFVISIFCGRHYGILSITMTQRRIRLRVNLFQLLIVLRFHFDLREFAHSAHKDRYVNLHGDLTYHWITDHLRIDARAVRKVLRVAIANGILDTRDRRSYQITGGGVRAIQRAVYQHQLFHVGTRLFPEKIAYLQNISEMNAKEIFTDVELRRVTAQMGKEYPYLPEKA